MLGEDHDAQLERLGRVGDHVLVEAQHVLPAGVLPRAHHPGAVGHVAEEGRRGVDGDPKPDRLPRQVRTRSISRRGKYRPPLTYGTGADTSGRRPKTRAASLQPLTVIVARTTPPGGPVGTHVGDLATDGLPAPGAVGRGACRTTRTPGRNRPWAPAEPARQRLVDDEVATLGVDGVAWPDDDGGVTAALTSNPKLIP